MTQSNFRWDRLDWIFTCVDSTKVWA